MLNIMGGLKISDPLKKTSVAECYKGRNILITGATGFMGKVLVEKLLWSCEGIGNLYLLIRNKKGLNPRERVQNLLESPAFDRLREQKPKIIDNIIPIFGDIIEENLGISDEDRKLLESSVSIVFHVASSVRFDDPLKKAVLINVRGTRDVVNLARKMKNLKALVYVSTSYCNSDKLIIEEQVYSSDIDWKMMIRVAETSDEYTLNIVQPKIIAPRPNTYTFTKFLAENIIKDYSDTIPSIIFRPSIVSYCVAEPHPGWVDNLNGPIGLCAGVTSGILHVIRGDENSLPDFIPCDRAINGIILSAWYKSNTESKECHVINAANGNKLKTSINFLSKFKDEALIKMPPSRLLWYPSYLMTKNIYLYNLMYLFTHIVPGLFIDFILHMKNVDLRLMKIYRKVYIANSALAYFTCNEWKILTHNYDSLESFLTNDDKKTFKCITDDISESDGVKLGALALKKYIFKDDLCESAVSSAKRQLIRMFWLDRITRSSLFLLFLYYFIKLSLTYILPIISNIIL